MKFTKNQLDAQANQIEIGSVDLDQSIEDTWFDLRDEILPATFVTINIKKVNTLMNKILIAIKGHNEYVKEYNRILKALQKYE